MLVIGIASVHEARAGIIKSTIGLAVLGGLVYYLYNNYYLPQQAAQDQKNSSLAVQSSSLNSATSAPAVDQQPASESNVVANTGAQPVQSASEQSEVPVSTDVTA